MYLVRLCCASQIQHLAALGAVAPLECRVFLLILGKLAVLLIRKEHSIFLSSYGHSGASLLLCPNPKLGAVLGPCLLLSTVPSSPGSPWDPDVVHACGMGGVFLSRDCLTSVCTSFCPLLSSVSMWH